MAYKVDVINRKHLKNKSSRQMLTPVDPTISIDEVAQMLVWLVGEMVCKYEDYGLAKRYHVATTHAKYNGQVGYQIPQQGTFQQKNENDTRAKGA